MINKQPENVVGNKNNSNIEENKDNETRNARAAKQAQSENGESDGRIAEIAILTGATDNSG